METKVVRKVALTQSDCTAMYAPAIDELPELQATPFIATYQRIARDIEANDRVEVIATHDGETVGALVLVLEEDMHVGPCLTVQWAYVLPKHRGRAGICLYREVLAIAKRMKAPYLAYTHRSGHMKYTLTYRRMYG